MSTPIPPDSTALDRRTFVKTLSTAGIGVAAFGQSLWSAEKSKATNPGSARKRYVIVGVGSRHQMYQDAIERDYRDHAELVGICDTNPGR
ncbi:MAG: twin-arginine translocation signal domain-containing protein, partial [Opitutus sp.]